jgi:hypothetical protein
MIYLSKNGKKLELIGVLLEIIYCDIVIIINEITLFYLQVSPDGSLGIRNFGGLSSMIMPTEAPVVTVSDTPDSVIDITDDIIKQEKHDDTEVIETPTCEEIPER